MAAKFIPISSNHAAEIKAAINKALKLNMVSITTHAWADHSERGNSPERIRSVIRNATRIAVIDDKDRGTAIVMITADHRVVIGQDKFRKGNFVVLTCIPVDRDIWKKAGTAV
jgi:hypothetical protein